MMDVTDSWKFIKIQILSSGGGVVDDIFCIDHPERDFHVLIKPKLFK